MDILVENSNTHYGLLEQFQTYPNVVNIMQFIKQQ